MKPIIGLVGPSGAGKTTLLLAAVDRLPDKVGIYKSYATRPRRSDEDDLFFTFVTPEEIKRREASGELFQVSEYAGNYYANDHEQLDSVLRDRFGIGAIVEQGVRNFRAAGYRVIVVNVVPQNAALREDEARRQADEKRARSGLAPDFTIVNSFEPGGLEKAVNELLAIIRSLA